MQKDYKYPIKSLKNKNEIGKLGRSDKKCRELKRLNLPDFDELKEKAYIEEKHFDICEKRHIAIITNIIFGKSKNSKYEDIVYVAYSYWDSETHSFMNSQAAYDHIYTSGKHRFQTFCREFGAIDYNLLQLDNILGAMCMVEYYLLEGKKLRKLSRDEKRAYDKIMDKFNDVKRCEEIVDIPDIIGDYWICNVFDPNQKYRDYYYGIITDIKEKMGAEEKEHIVTVMVLIDGEQKKYKFYTNGESNYKYLDLNNLCNGYVNEESIKELKYTGVKVKLYKTKKGDNVYINEIIAEDFESDNQKIQIDMLGEYWLENIALPKK